MKLWTYTIIMVGMMIFLEILGIPTGTTAILNFVGIDINTGVNTDVSSLRTLIFTTILGAVAVGGVVLGFITKTQPENYILIPLLTGFAALFINFFLNIIDYSFASGASWSAYVVLMILAPLEVGWFVTVAEWFRGTD